MSIQRRMERKRAQDIARKKRKAKHKPRPRPPSPEELERILDRRRFVKKAAAVTAGVAAGGLGVLYYKKNVARRTWKPGDETWLPAIEEAPPELDTVDKAVWLVRENLCRYSIDDLKRMELEANEVYYIVSHQLRVEPLTSEKLAFYLDALEVRESPYTGVECVGFPEFMQAHDMQFLDTLFRCGVNRDHKFKVGGRTTSMRSIFWDELRDFPTERLAMANADPSWIIGAFVGLNPSMDEWMMYGDMGIMLRYIAYGSERDSDTGLFRFQNFCCSGLHYWDAISRLHWYYGQHLKENEIVPEFQKETTRYLKLLTPHLRDGLKEHSDGLVPAIEDFRDEPTKEAWRRVFKTVGYVGHALELMLEPKGYYRTRVSKAELEPAARALSDGIILWYSPELKEGQEKTDDWVYYSGYTEEDEKLEKLTPRQRREVEEYRKKIRRYVPTEETGKCTPFMNASLLHACHGLMRYRELQSEKQAGN